MLKPKNKVIIFSVEHSKTEQLLDKDVLDILVEHHIGIKNDKHWIIPLYSNFPEPIDERTNLFSQFVQLAKAKGFTDLMVTK